MLQVAVGAVCRRAPRQHLHPARESSIGDACLPFVSDCTLSPSMLAGIATPLRAAAGPRGAAFQRWPGALARFKHHRPGAPMQPRLLRQAHRRLPGGAGDARVVGAAAADSSQEQQTTVSLPGQLGECCCGWCTQ